MHSVKILHIISSIQRGGRERQLSTLVTANKLSSSRLKIIYFNDTTSSYIAEYCLGKYLIKLKSKNFTRRLLEIKAIIKDYKPDVIFTWGNLESIFALFLIPFFNFKFINGSLRHGVRAKKLSHYLRTLILKLSPYVIANSTAGLYANHLKPGERRIVLYNGISKVFLKTSSKKEVIQTKSTLANGLINNQGYVFISIANLVPYKDYITVFKALSEYKKTQEFNYLIIGDGPMRSEIKNVISSFGLEKYVKLLGRIENITDYLFISDLMIHSSRGEGISNAILEGMYAGLPIIATDVGGVPETVFPGSSILFPYKDHEALYQCLLKAPELINSFNLNDPEYQLHLKKFSLETMIDRFEEIIKEVMLEKK